MAKSPEEKHEWFEAILKERERRKGGCIKWELFCFVKILASYENRGWGNYENTVRHDVHLDLLCDVTGSLKLE